MKVSVVICTYSPDIYEHFCDAVESVLAQTHDPVELVLVVDGNEELHERVVDDFGDHPGVETHCNEENVGLSASRNNALAYVTGDVVAFMDDDAVADERWVEELVAVYESTDAIAAGGRMTPLWVAGKPRFLPEEFYWLVGVNPPGFADAGEEVRNTYGSNISFRAWVLDELDGFETQVGRRGEKNLQAEEPELCVRMRERYGQGVVYNPEATVGHKVFGYRTEFRWLLERAFWQGYSKRGLETVVSEDATDTETEFLTELLFESVPSRVGSFVRSPSLSKLLQFVTLFVFTAVVGFGYLYGVLKWRE